MRVQFLILSVLITACTNQRQIENDNGQAVTDTSTLRQRQEGETIEVDVLGAKEKIERERSNISNVTGDFNDFKEFIKNLDKSDFYAISTTANYLSVFLPKTEQQYRDSTYLYFVDVFYTVVNKQTDSLNFKYPAVMRKLEQNKIDEDTKSFEEFLKLFGTGLFMSEGMFYLDVDSNYFLRIFDKQVSNGLNKYLNLRSLELSEGFSEDAGLLISFDKVYERVVKWEELITEYPNSIMLNSANFYFETYLETLLTGMDNSRVFDFESKKLNSHVKEIFDSVIKADLE